MSKCFKCFREVEQDEKYCGCGFQLVCCHRKAPAYPGTVYVKVKKGRYHWKAGDYFCRVCGQARTDLQWMVVIRRALIVVFVLSISMELGSYERRHFFRWQSLTMVACVALMIFWLTIRLRSLSIGPNYLFRIERRRLEARVDDLGDHLRAIVDGIGQLREY